MLTFGTCKKPELAGEDLLPDFPHDNIFQADTFTIIAETELWDTVKATASNGTYLLGNFNDPIFGRTDAGFYTQFSFNETPTANAVVDSVVLTLRYFDQYGNADKLNGAQRVRVFELIDSLGTTRTFHTSDHHLFAQELGAKTFWPDYNHSVPVGTAYLAPQLRIRLNNEFGMRLLQADYTDEKNFKANFKGFAVIPDNQGLGVDQGAIISFKLNDAVSGVTLYTHVDTSSKTFTYPFNSTCAAHSWFRHEYNPDLAAHFDNPILGREKLFVQSNAGTRVRLRFPYLGNLSLNSLVVISRAQLICPIQEWSDHSYPAPTDLALQQNYPIKSQDDLRDSLALFLLYEFEPTSSVNYDADQREYVLDLSLYMQRVMNGDYGADSAIYITTTAPVQTGLRTVLNGPGHATRPMRLRILYTKLEP